ncbi:tyrosine-type recombinase/integrase [Novosphingopyxis iocasae]|uniref:tyrosine-type recombinase/integrase n=1 Tax=Novosphingopyxis iocasae TaxID=2762729 RepID=UPI0016517368|nr:integrase arm-type DNA-binding domain-containing protein [Novosphingopyxis iocasae]
MLTDRQVRTAKPREKAYKLADRNSLFLHVSPKGHKSFRYKYRFDGKEQLLVIGAYPDIGLGDAREAMENARKLLKDGRNPKHDVARRRLLGNMGSDRSFEVIARRWYAQQVDRWKPVHAQDVMRSMEQDLFPDIGQLPLEDIDTELLLAVLSKVQDRGAIESAHRLKQRVRSVYQFAKGMGIKCENPAFDVGEAMKRVPKARRYPALIKIDEIRQFLSVIDTAGASPVTRLASRFLALVAQRPGMVRRAEWSDIRGIDFASPGSDSSDALWVVPAEKMKLDADQRQDDDYDHHVPLSAAAVDTLRAAHRLSGNCPYIFPAITSGLKPISENAIGYLYNREGYKGRHVPHGWRSSFSTIMNEAIGVELGQDIRMFGDRLIIDLMLAHVPAGMSESEFRYNRARYMPRRRELSEEWAALIMEGAIEPDAIIHSPRRKRRT